MKKKKKSQDPQDQPPVNPTPAGAAANVINSIAQEETALAALITQLAAEINAVLTTNPSPTDLQVVDTAIRAKLRVILKKNIVLLKKLTDAQNLIPTPLTPAEIAALVGAFNAVLVSIAAEETALAALIRAEANKVNFVSVEREGDTIGDLVTTDQNVRATLGVILDKNIVLEEKLLEVLGGLGNLGVTTTTPVLGPTITNSLVTVINSIAAEESALAFLMTAEANKIANAVSDVLEGEATVPELGAVNSSVGFLLETILLKNIILQTKLDEIEDFLFFG